MTGLKQLEEQLAALLQGEHSSLHLTLNDENGPNYMSVKEYAEQFDDFDSWISDGERQRAIETNRCWSLQWYPRTPVGFNIVRGSSLEAVINGAIEIAKDEAA